MNEKIIAYEKARQKIVEFKKITNTTYHKCIKLRANNNKNCIGEAMESYSVDGDMYYNDGISMNEFMDMNDDDVLCEFCVNVWGRRNEKQQLVLEFANCKRTLSSLGKKLIRESAL